MLVFDDRPKNVPLSDAVRIRYAHVVQDHCHKCGTMVDLTADPDTIGLLRVKGDSANGYEASHIDCGLTADDMWLTRDHDGRDMDVFDFYFCAYTPLVLNTGKNNTPKDEFGDRVESDLLWVYLTIENGEGEIIHMDRELQMSWLGAMRYKGREWYGMSRIEESVEG